MLNFVERKTSRDMNISAFMIGASTTFFTIFALHILLWRRRRSRFQNTLGCIMAVWALWCLKDIILTFPGMYRPQVLNWIMVVDGWSALSYTAFIAEVVMPRWFTIRRFLVLCLPFAAFTIAYALHPTQAVLYAYAIFLWFYAWVVVIVGWAKMRQCLAYVRKNYSNIDSIDVSWLRPVFLFATIGQLAWLGISFYASVIADIFYYLSIIALWCMVLYYSWDFRPIIMEPEPAVLADIPSGDAVPSLPAHPTLPKGMLERLMDEEQLYLKRDLTLTDLAQALGTNRTYVSNYFSQVLHQTFYDYINQLRIERISIPMLREHPEYKLEYVATESGFASISTFRRAFVRLTGQTPGQFSQNDAS